MVKTSLKRHGPAPPLTRLHAAVREDADPGRSSVLSIDTLTIYIQLRRELASVNSLMSGVLESEARAGRMRLMVEQLDRAQLIARQFLVAEEALS